MMKWLKELKSFLLLAFVIGFLFSATLSGCGNKNKEGDKTEQSAGENEEHPNDNEEHPN